MSDLPVPEENTINGEQYRKDLHTLARAKSYIARVFTEEDAIDFMIKEIKNYYNDGEFSKYVYEYAEKEKPMYTEEELAQILPKTEDGKPIFSYRDL